MEISIIQNNIIRILKVDYNLYIIINFLIFVNILNMALEFLQIVKSQAKDQKGGEED